MATKTLLTVEQFEQLPEAEGVSYELDEGELVEVASPIYYHNRVRGRVERLVGYHLDTNPDQGEIVAEQSFRLGESTVRIPDVAVIGPDQLPLLERERSIQQFAPMLVIEVTSPSNTFHEIARRIQQYLDGGTKAVWVFETARREIHIYSAGTRTRILMPEDVLEDSALLPGFSVRVADLFKM